MGDAPRFNYTLRSMAALVVYCRLCSEAVGLFPAVEEAAVVALVEHLRVVHHEQKDEQPDRTALLRRFHIEEPGPFRRYLRGRI